MKFVKVIAATVAALASTPGNAAEHWGLHPTGIHADPENPCVFFYTNAAQPDPAVPQAHIFAIPRTHPAFAELFALLVTAKATNATIYVRTTGRVGCAGQAEVAVISLNN